MTIVRVERFNETNTFFAWKICFTDKQVAEFRQEQERACDSTFNLDFTEYSPEEFLELSMGDISTMRISDYQRIMYHIS